jgi:hypothetical protein
VGRTTSFGNEGFFFFLFLSFLFLFFLYKCRVKDYAVDFRQFLGGGIISAFNHRRGTIYDTK